MKTKLLTTLAMACFLAGSLPLSAVPAAREWHTAVWTGSEMIVWGGINSSGSLDSGGCYDPAIDNWTPVNLLGAPAARAFHTAVWTGSQMIIWGGDTASPFGGRYDPNTRLWTAVGTNGAPTPAGGTPRLDRHGNDRLGRVCASGGLAYLGDGARYNPLTDTWTAMSTNGAPDGAATTQSGVDGQ